MRFRDPKMYNLPDFKSPNLDFFLENAYGINQRKMRSMERNPESNGMIPESHSVTPGLMKQRTDTYA